MTSPLNPVSLRPVPSSPGAGASVMTWPAAFPSEQIAVSAVAVRTVGAEGDAVFDWVRRVDLHAGYYPQLRGVRRLRGGWPQLQRGTAFSMTIGALVVPFVRVIELDLEQRSLSWGLRTPLLSVCHRFTVESTQGGALLRSQEAAAGPLARVLAFALRGPLQKIQDDWTDALAKAIADHPDGPPNQ